MNNPVKVKPLYNPAQGKPPNVERFSSTMCIVHAGFSGLRTFIARKKSWCKLIGNHFVIPHDTIHSTLCTK